MNKICCILASATFPVILLGCGNKSSGYIPISDLDSSTSDSELPEEMTFSQLSPEMEIEEINDEQDSFEIPYKQHENGVKTIHVKINDSVGYDAIFDTGCSGFTISTQEARSLVKAGTLTQDDLLGQTYSTIANGQTVANYVYNIRQLSFTDTNGEEHTIYDVPVTIMSNPTAPILIGNSVLENLASESFTVDLQNQRIIFQ